MLAARRLPPLALAALLVVSAACRSSQREAQEVEYEPVEEAEMGQMRNVATSNGVWSGGLPSVPDLDLAHRRGIEVAIDLCTIGEKPDTYDLRAVCGEIGIELVEVEIPDEGELSDDVVDSLLAQLERGRPTLIFCGNGGRSAMLFAIYRILHDKVPVEDALIEARRAGMKPGAPEDFVRRTVERRRKGS